VKLAVEHLPNAWQITENVISGGLPDGDAAFQQLAELGVQTVISVDGMKPDAAAARKHGLRYVHLPHGYDGVPEERAQELAKAVRDLPGPIYIHCHHGKHRSPSAAAVACVGAGVLDRSLAETVLKTAGTSENYQGLYASARSAEPFDAALLDALQAEFPEASAVPPLAEAMVALEHTHDHLKQIAAAGWQTPAGHPDLDPTHEALLLREHFAELLRMDEVTQQPEAFRQSLRESETAAQALENALRASPVSAEAAQSSLDRVGQRCAACHQEYRDQPLSEQRRADFQVRPAP
jgi:cytochrome c556